MHKVKTQQIPRIAGPAIRIDLTALFGQLFSGIAQFFQRLFGPRVNG